MSLWQKPIGDINFADIDAFCLTQQAEGMRLDYKVDLDDGIVKTIAGFANTFGGLILVGVDAEKTTNQPIWPSQNRGMPTKPGQAERVIQWSRDRIYPPVLPEVSTVIPNLHLAGHDLLVLRVPESVVAPHAIEGKKAVFVYERRENQNDPFQLADIDRVEQLLKRRSRLDSQREAMIQQMLVRVRSHFAKSFLPIRWASILPYFPSEELWTQEQCWEAHKFWANFCRICARAQWERPRRAPGGSIALAKEHDFSKGNATVAMTSMNSQGHAFAAEYMMEVMLRFGVNEATPVNPFTPGQRLTSSNFNYSWTKTIVSDVVEWAGKCLSSGKMRQPGFLMCSLGIEEAFGLRMQSQAAQGSPYADQHFRVDVPVPVHEFLKDPSDVMRQILAELEFSFDLSVPQNEK